jgi:NADH:flavin oxidoreductases, Old Yellow Enzyme family
MADFSPFRFADEQAFRAALSLHAPALPYEEDVSILAQPLAHDGATLANRLVVHPMEGADGTADGSPDELTFRRYHRFAHGGAALLWYEATAVVPEGRANPRQLYLHDGNVDAFRRLLDESRAIAAAQGRTFYAVLQLTHSGRQSFPSAAGPDPIIAYDNPVLDRRPGRVVSDAELDALQEKYIHAAQLAADIGFDAVDVKACHGYLIQDLLTARERPGKYGGSFDNRVRFIVETLDGINAKVGKRIGLASRYGVWDSIPGGWGIDEKDYHKADFSEPIALANMMHDRGVTLFDVTCGNPYFNPHVNRPFDRGFYTPPEHPLEGAQKLLQAAQAIQKALPEATVIATGLSWLRQYGAGIAAGMVRDGWCKLAGFGRQAFAYPDFAADICSGRGMDPDQCCIACGNCTQIMRDGGRSGCMVRDKDVYMPIFRAGRDGKPPVKMDAVSEHI